LRVVAARDHQSPILRLDRAGLDSRRLPRGRCGAGPRGRLRRGPASRTDRGLRGSGGRAGGGMRTLSKLLLAAAIATPIGFRRDHGALVDAPLEWWYWTGHLAGEGGRAYGFQVTFFRLRDLHLAHFAWSDVGAGKFSFDEKTHLALPGIAGASEQKL